MPIGRTTGINDQCMWFDPLSKFFALHGNFKIVYELN